MKHTTHTIQTNHAGEVSLPQSVIEICSSSGESIHDVRASLLRPEVKAELDKITSSDIAKELEDTGAWDEEELEDTQANLERFLWIICGNASDEIFEQSSL